MWGCPDRPFKPANFCILGLGPGPAPRPGTPRLGDAYPSPGCGMARAGGPGEKAPTDVLVFLRGQCKDRQLGSALDRGADSKEDAGACTAGSPPSPASPGQGTEAREEEPGVVGSGGYKPGDACSLRLPKRLE